MGEATRADRSGATRALVMGTAAFTVCFAAWVVNAVLITYLVSTGLYAFSSEQVAWLLAVPILTGAVGRVPLGVLADRYGGRGVLTALMLAVALPMYLMSVADSFAGFLLASFGFGFAGASFAVGVTFVSAWTAKERQGTALGIFGMGNAGAALTTLVAPQLLSTFTQAGVDGWRAVPRVYAATLVVTAIVFFLSTQERITYSGKGVREMLAPLGSIVVWRFGLYYFLVFGSFVALAQWIVPYGVNVYSLSVAQAGLLATAFSLPGGLIRAGGGWLSDRFGARTVSYWVFGTCILFCAVLSVPRMDIASPGAGVLAEGSGRVTAVTSTSIVVDDRYYTVIPPPAELPADLDRGDQFLPSLARWQEPVVEVGDTVVPRQLLAGGVSRIYYPANFWLFAVLVMLFGVSTGVGKAAVYKFIPEQFPGSVGAVGGMVGLIGALGGFVLPLVFGALLSWTGLWSSAWIVLTALSAGCLMSMHIVVRRIMADEAPQLAQLIERHPRMLLQTPVELEEAAEATSLEDLLARIPFFDHLTPEKLKELARVGRTKTFSAGETIFREGDAGDALCVLLRGSARIHSTEFDGDVEIAMLQPGAFFGELALLDGQPRSATATAIEPCELFLLDRRTFLYQLARSPRMIADLLVGLSGKLRANVARIRLSDTSGISRVSSAGGALK